MGFIKPRLLDYDLKIESTEEWDRTKIDLEGRLLGKVKLGQISKYRFFCEEPKGCCDNRPHNMEIRDWEANELYRNIIRRDTNHAAIREKMKFKLFDWLRAKREAYFLMGTHHRWKVWMIGSVLYPPKKS